MYNSWDYYEEVCSIEAYLDNSATTRVCSEAIDGMLDCLKNNWGNPSSLHEKGIQAEDLLERARKTVAGAIGCEPSEIVFTSGGTQSNNIAVFGAVEAAKRKGNKIITSSVEHPSVMKAFDRLESEGYEVVRLRVDRFGRVDLEQLKNELDEKTVLVSVMAVNNELGTIEPIKEISTLIKKSGCPALFHVDAVQAFGKIPLSVRSLGVDLMSISSHKIHGPKGAGALYVKKGVRLVSPVVGGGQEKDLRPGTEPMPAIAGFAGAVSALTVQKSLEKITALRNQTVEKLKNMDGVVLNSPDDALPYIINLSLPGLPSEAVLNLLSNRNIYVSSGSACAKGHKSPVLTAAGLDTERINSSLRISFSRFTEETEIEMLLDGINKALSTLRRKK